MVRRPTPLLRDLLGPLGVAPALLAATVYFAVAPDLPSLGAGEAARFATTGLGMLIVGGLILLVTSLRDAGLWLLPLIAIEALVAIGLTGEGFLEIATSFKLVAAGSAGLVLARYVPFPGLAYLIAAVVIGVDIVSVAAGPTRQLIEHHQETANYLSLLIPEWGRSDAGVELGVADVIFMAGFMSFVYRFGLRVRTTAAALVVSLLASLATSIFAARAVPALPLLSLALLLPNIDTVWRQVREELRRGPKKDGQAA